MNEPHEDPRRTEYVVGLENALRAILELTGDDGSVEDIVRKALFPKGDYSDAFSVWRKNGRYNDVSGG